MYFKKTNKIMKRKIFIVCFVLYVSFFNIHCGGNRERIINHVVLVWLKEDQPQGLVAEIMSEALKLKNIKAVKMIHIGSPIKSEREIVDSSFDLGIYMKFNSVQEMNIYLQDPRHVEFYKTFIQANAKKVLVYDF